MTTVTRFFLTLALCALAAPVLASSSLQVIRLEIVRASPDGFQPNAVLVQFQVAVPDERILGLSEDSAIESWTDDKGADLLAMAEPPPADEMGMGQVVSRVINNIRHDRVSVNREGDAILITAVTAARPSEGAGALSLDGKLILEVAGEGEETVTLENVSLEADGFDRIEFDVKGARLTCSLDSGSRTPQLQISRFYCYAPGLRPLRFVARGTDLSDVPPEEGRANLIVVGPTDDVTVDIMLPVAEELEVPLDLDIGLGLGG